MGTLALVIFGLTAANLLIPASGDGGPVVQTKLGAVKGGYVTAKGKDTLVHSYLGLPFAKPPVGPLRLASPQPAQAWEGVRDATKQPPICVQDRELLVNILREFAMNSGVPEMSEDCLYLNVYTPAKPGEDVKLPVMVWIHGGALTLGSASMQDGSVLAAYQNVVLVVIQYRLGLLGFLSTGDKHAPGNYGLLDQVAALQWVQENVRSFGGDPGLVTIFGESAGGLSVSFQVLSPMSAGLFRYAIAESGTAAMDTLVTYNPLPFTQSVAKASGCDVSSTKKIVDCIMQWPVKQLVQIAQKGGLFSFKVTVDGRFLPKPVDELLRNKEFNKVPFITGVTNDEGAFNLINFFAHPGWDKGMDREQFLSLIPFIFPDSNDKRLYELVANEYLGTTNDPIKIRDGLREMYGDIMFNIPARKVANYHKESGAPVYLYEFQHSYHEILKKKRSFAGCDHGEEIFFVFGCCFLTYLTSQPTEKENELCRTVMAYWGNFARTGSPNGPGLTTWPEIGTEAEYLSIGLEQKPGKSLKGRHYTFITQTLPRLLHERKDDPVVQTKLGAVKGMDMKAKGKDTVVYSYLGLPFAKPPIGSLRLAPPQPAEAWKGVRDGTKQPPICVQDRQTLVDLAVNLSMIVEIPEMSEDCLYLNIYTPAKPDEDAKLPVMVWIHGGGLVMGSASVFDGHVLAAYQNVVVVLIQYRLGLLGFVSTGDKHAPGNYGLLDQVAALQWVQENIQSFGGDPGLVTIFGESAGGISVSLQILSPLSSGLFHNAIAQSGTAATDIIFIANPLPTAQILANASGCDITSTKRIADCIMQWSEEDILRLCKENSPVPFGVTTDGHFLPEPVDELLQQRRFSKVPLTVGVTDDEAGRLLADFFSPPGWLEGLDREQVMPALNVFYPDPNNKWIHEVLADEYLGTSNNRIKIREGYRELLGDLIFNIPTRKVAKYHKDVGAPVYMYEFQHPPSVLQKKRPSFVRCEHADELFFVFGMCFANGHIKTSEKLTKEEDELCKTVMAYWGNFARTGSPNGPGLTPWPEHGIEAEYLGIGLEQKPGKNLKDKHYTFITKTIPRMIRERKDGPVVQTKFGAVKGDYVTAKGKDTVVHSYLGLPFAKPPVGSLRLAPPQPAEAWRGVRDGAEQPPMCIQNRQFTVDLMSSVSMKMDIPDVSEDCLYLNVYTPATPGEDAKLPVMVWIHGGGFAMGSASFYDGSVLSAYQNVVVVLIQYRLGLLGFFSTGDEHAPGNYGLLDQVAALQWVQENIQSFGGDPGSVTIFGESAGGASVSFLLLSPLSAGLFHRAIAESGSAAMPGIVNDPLPMAQYIANVSGCDISSTQKIAECVKSWPEKNLIKLAQESAFFFVATIDKNFLPEPVEELLQKHEFSKVPLLIGVNDDEFGWLMPKVMATPGWTDGMSREQIISSMSAFNPNPNDHWIKELVADEYIGTAVDPIELRDSYKEMMADMVFNVPALKVAKFHKAAGAPVYLYEFQHSPSIIESIRPSFVGSDHGDEIVFVFGMCFGNAHVKTAGKFTEKENKLCKTVMAYWGNFARTGSPNGPGLTAWPKYGNEVEYLGIGLEQKPGKNLKTQRYIFMTETLPELMRTAQEKKEHTEL